MYRVQQQYLPHNSKIVVMVSSTTCLMWDVFLPHPVLWQLNLQNFFFFFYYLMTFCPQKYFVCLIRNMFLPAVEYGNTQSEKVIKGKNDWQWVLWIINALVQLSNTPSFKLINCSQLSLYIFKCVLIWFWKIKRISIQICKVNMLVNNIACNSWKYYE